MVKLLLTLGVFLYSAFSFSQDFIDGSYIWTGETSENISENSQPELTDPILKVRSQGDLMSFSEGYQIGDYVADFTLYDHSMEDLNMNALLEKSSISGKYTILFSASNSCNKSTAFFNANSTDYIAAQTFMSEHLEDFNWLMIYGYEAHPIDSENSPSNCSPTAKSGPIGEGEYQHKTYQDRLNAIKRWRGIQNGSISASKTISTYTYNSENSTGKQFQNYKPLDLDIPVYADSPNNLIYDTYFKKPFGILIIDCSGQVVNQGDWLDSWMIDENKNGITGVEYLNALLNDDEALSCHEWVDFCSSESLDSDSDGLCDKWEIQNQTNPSDICHPFGEDSDFDGLCNLAEEELGLDPFNPDSDKDHLSDHEEIIIGTDPHDPDSDGDGDLDGDEISKGNDPLNSDDFSAVEELESELSFSMVNDSNSGNIKLEMSESDSYSISLRSTDGKSLISDMIDSSEYILDPKEYSAGTYLISVEDSRGRLKTQRIFIE